MSSLVTRVSYCFFARQEACLASYYEKIVDLTNKVLAQYDFALTLRQIYYRLVAMSAIPNKRFAYNSLSGCLVKARERGQVDDSRIEDRSREVLAPEDTYDDPDAFTEVMTEGFKRIGSEYYADLWANQKEYIEVWVEKDALSRVVARAAEPWRVAVCPSRGYSSYTYIKRVAVDGRFSKLPADKPIVILDFRDHDPSGIQMTEDLATRFRRYTDREVVVKRVALTIEQVKKYDLIPNPTKVGDTRTANYVTLFGDKCWELDAIEPRELQRIVDEAIKEHVNMARWKRALALEVLHREALEEKFKKARISFRR